jgi:hypothetical protein
MLCASVWSVSDGVVDGDGDAWSGIGNDDAVFGPEAREASMASRSARMDVEKILKKSRGISPLTKGGLEEVCGVVVAELDIKCEDADAERGGSSDITGLKSMVSGGEMFIQRCSSCVKLGACACPSMSWEWRPTAAAGASYEVRSKNACEDFHSASLSCLNLRAMDSSASLPCSMLGDGTNDEEAFSSRDGERARDLALKPVLGEAGGVEALDRPDRLRSSAPWLLTICLDERNQLTLILFDLASRRCFCTKLKPDCSSHGYIFGPFPMW